MNETLNLKHKFGHGITPQQFMETMETRVMEQSKILNTKDQFLYIYENFSLEKNTDNSFFNSFRNNQDLYCLILCTDWCPDVIWNVPVLFRVMEKCNIPTEVLLMEEHLETMDHFLTDGVRNQPIAVILDKNGNVLGRWGARPAYIQAVMDKFKSSNPDKGAPDYKEKIGKVYGEIGELYHLGTHYQKVILQELTVLFSSIKDFG
ncbi:thioredoxin-like protein [Cytobacillus firmus]|uniref:Thioredoxin-like protein n=2 Tax=Cytobacillus TaxID=2675230 RepID=A0A366JEJ1_CYTFI|nr:MULTISPECIES: thioredoxin family protein [Cytobacillus]RBP85396.1 thioredoxin-like protein [Cytobacillus firmus]TDX35479.1 thioredoxin-like protein [Cytobacillus oceanisediminis]